jgi:hypothetical protein
MLSSGMNRLPVHRFRAGRKPVRTVVPTTWDVLFDASRRPRADAHTTFPQSVPPQGAISMIALPIGFFQRPSIAARGGLGAGQREKGEANESRTHGILL